MAKFEKGQSGNPGGRPKIEKEIRELAQQHCATAITMLAAWSVSDDPKASIPASIALLDRGLGKPAQPVHGDDEKPPAYMIIDRLRPETQNGE